jgi:hypothetical protein
MGGGGYQYWNIHQLISPHDIFTFSPVKNIKYVIIFTEMRGLMKGVSENDIP